jgi:pSer/pThr/pTyr-binding forkhead associated (FHA) protein/thioredoxin reductase/ferredoxin
MSVFIRLIFHTGSWAGQEVVTPVPMLRIGSDASKNDIVLFDDLVADAHCIVQRSPRGEYILEDLSQLSHSMMINGQEFADADAAIYLSPGDRFHVGISEIEVADANPRLLQTAGEHPGREITLSEQLLSFGRAPDNAVVFDDSEASIYHAVIRSTSLGLSLEDQRSTNGTFVNGKKVSSHMLCDGDTIKLGHQEFLFLADERDNSMEAPGENGTRRMDEVRAYFLMLAGGQRGEYIELGSYPVLIGSAPDSDFELTDPDAAAAHCRIVPSEDLYYLEHLGSDYSKTLLNGRAVGTSPELLHPGDLLSIGSSVAEFRAVGGVASETGLTMVMTSVIAAGAYDLSPQAKYVVNGHVEMGTELSIGSSPTCHLHLDGEDIGAMHCRIRYAGGFFLEDTSVHGTYLGDMRIVREELQSGHVIRVGRELIDVTIHGERCTLDVIDRQTAMAAIEVAHETAFDLKMAELDQANMGGAGTNAYKTIYKLDFADVESLVRERKEKFNEGAPTWRPSTDIQRSGTVRVGMFLTILAAMGLAFFAYQQGETTGVLVNHPLSESHSSVRFVQQAEELAIESDCRACHRPGQGVRAELCVRCHEGFDTTIREQHLTLTAPTELVLPGSQCSSCHSEHTASPRFVSGAPSVLGAARGCVGQGCHENQHSDRKFEAAKAGPNAVEAGPVPSFDMPLEEFHIAHATIDLDGKKLAVSCTTCHAEEDASGALVERDPGKACFGCHTGGGAEVATQCLSCHGLEHGTDHGFERLPDDSPLMVGTTTPVSPGRSLLWAFLIMGAVFAPALLFGMMLRIRAKSAANRVVAKLGEIPLETVKHLVHSLNREKCVGCHACVQACPTSVLELVNHKSQVVNFDACIQCKACENSCAFGALVMHDADKPAPTTKTPDLDGSLQTPIPGLYLIGQAAGIPQVKNASNMGRTVIEQAVQAGMRAGEGRDVGAQVDVLIVGSGPAGLSAALTCQQHGIRAMILEKQPEFAWTIRNYFHKGKPVMAEPHEVSLAGLLPIWDTNREELLAAWEHTIASNGLEIQYRQNVTNIEKVGQYFEVTVSDAQGEPVGRWSAARVIIAVGGMGTPRRLGCPGDELDKVRSALVDPQSFQDKEIMVVGGSDSAIEVALALCIQNRVHLSCRGKYFDRAKPKNRELMEEAFASGSIVPHFVTQVAEVTATTVVLEDRHDGKTIELPNDYVFALIGGIPPTSWLESLGVRYVARPHSWSPPPTDSMFRR